MGVKLTIEVEGPLGPGDKDTLTGATMILMSLAQQFVVPEPEEEETEASPCGDMEAFMEPSGPQFTGKVCISEVGHKGRHRYRDAPIDNVVPMDGGIN